VSHFHLREGDLVADFGAGSGHYMTALSEAVGADGRVYMCEIQKNLVTALGIRAQELRLTNVLPVWCDIETRGGTKLKDELLDAVLVSNVLFQCKDPEIVMTEAARVVRRGGKIFVIDWSDSYGGLGPASACILKEEKVRALGEKAGCTKDRTFPAGDHHYGVAFRKN
jgi:ubiquinone/menaquinone biosynthesis C-methylase UbiE